MTGFTQNNLVNNSVVLLQKAIPYQIRGLAFLFKKYTKIMHNELEQLASFKLGMINDSLERIMNIPYTKLLFTLNRDALVDLNTEVQTIPHIDYQLLSVFKLEGNHDVDIKDYHDGTTGRVSISSINYKYMMAPYLQLTPYFQSYYYDAKNVPLIKITPSIDFDTYNKNDGLDVSYYSSLYKRDQKDINTLGAGNSSCKINCDMVIDIESIFTLFMSIMSKAFMNRDGNKNCFDSGYKQSDTWNLDKFLEKSKWLCELSDNEFEKNFLVHVEELSKRIVFSACTTFLATVTKVDNVNNQFLTELSEDVLDIMKDKLMDDCVFDGDTVMKRGTFIRYITTNISALLNATLLAKTNSKSGLFNHLRALIDTQFGLKYCTYNYHKIPGDNLNIRHLVLLGQLAKSSSYLLDTSNRLDMSVLISDGNRSDSYKNIFLSKDAALINGTFATNKKFFDLGRALLQQLCCFIILRYKLSSLGDINSYKLPGTTYRPHPAGDYSAFGNNNNCCDNIYRNEKDYQGYIKSEYNALKRNISNLRNKIADYSEGVNESSIGDWEGGGGSMLSTSGKLQGLSKIIYGISNETVFSNTSISYLLDTESEIVSGDFNTTGITKYDKIQKCEPSDVYQSMIAVMGRQLQKMESRYADIRGMDSNDHCSVWFALNDRISKMIDHPWNRQVQDTSFSLLEILSGWGSRSYNQIAPSYDSTDINNNDSISSFWTRDAKSEVDKFYLKKSLTTLSEEDFENLITSLESKKANSEDLFGLFADGMSGIGIPLNQEVNLLEEETNNKDIGIYSAEQREKLNKLISRYDEYLDNNY